MSSTVDAPVPAATAADARHRPVWPTSGPWALVWRYGLCIVAWVISILGFTVLSVLSADPELVPDPVRRGPLVVYAIVDGLIGIAMIALMRLRHRHPVALAVTYAGLAVFATTGAMAAWWAYVHLCTRRKWREVVPVSLLMLVTGLGSDFVMRAVIGTTIYGPTEEFRSWTFYLVTLGFAALFTAVSAAIGFYVGARRDLMGSLRERAETAEREQELRVLQGQAMERNRIAREMHDVLAHRMSLVSMHAGALAFRDDLSPEATRDIARVIQENAHASLTELRGVLGSLRGDDPLGSLPPEKPQPTLADLDGLVDEARHGGQKIDLHREVQHPELLPALISRHAFRVLQEAVTNARKHAPHAKLKVSVTGAPGQGLTLASSNPLQTGATQVPGAGVGLVGLKERAQVTGGTIRHEVTSEGDFELKVWLPW